MIAHPLGCATAKGFGLGIELLPRCRSFGPTKYGMALMMVGKRYRGHKSYHSGRMSRLLCNQSKCSTF